MTWASLMLICGWAGVVMVWQRENSEVLPREAVAVAVTTPAPVPGTLTLNAPAPDPSVMTMDSPRYVCPSPAPEGSQATLWKNCRL